MALNGQARVAYKHFLDKSMSSIPEVEEPTSNGLMNRNRPVTKSDNENDSPDFLMDQFKQLQKLRAGLKNV